MVVNAVIYIVLTVVFSKIFGIPGLIYANMVNMMIRALWSLHISLENHNKMNKNQTSLKKVILQITKSKIFIGLLAFGVVATISGKYVLESILVWKNGKI